MSQLHSITHGVNGLILGYAVVLVPLLLGLRQGRAPLEMLLRGPLLAVPVTLGSGIVVSILSTPLRGLGVDREGAVQAVFGALVCMGVGYVAGRWFAARKGASDSEHRRGAIVDAEQGDAESQSAGWLAMRPRRVRAIFGGETGASGAEGGVTLAGIPVALQDETKHFKLLGTTGTGKSTAIRELLSGALARGDRAIIADPDGGYLHTFYDADRGDVILNPFTPGSAKWSLLGEIRTDYDVEQLARSLIPDSGDHDRSWCDYARTFFCSVVQQAIVADVQDDGELERLITQASDEELRALLSTTSAGPLLAKGGEKMLGSVRSITNSAIRALKYITKQDGKPFSVRTWVSQGASRHAGGAAACCSFRIRRGRSPPSGRLSRPGCGSRSSKP